jgi:hypothetical protein
MTTPFLFAHFSVVYNARMIRMASKAFLESVKKDPLFAAEGMNLERGEAALNRIKDVVGDIEHAISSSSFLRRLFLLRYPILRYIVPFSFVQSFIESERCRRRFLFYSTYEAGNCLIDNWKKTQKDFEDGVKRFSKIHQVFFELESETSSEPFHDTHGNITLPEDFDKQVESLKKNADALRKEISERRALLLGERKEWIYRKLDAKPLEYIPGNIPEKYKRICELELEHGLQSRRGTLMEKYGPLVYTFKNFDGKPTAHNFMLHFLRNNENGIENLKITSTDLFLFIHIEKNSKKDPHRMRPHAYIKNIGTTYWYQPATSLYTARDQVYLADLATIIDLKRRPELDRDLVSSQKSSLLDFLLGTCAEDHIATLGNLKEYLYTGVFAPKHAFTLFMMRSNPSIYFLPFNRSVWRLAEAPNFLGSGRVRPEDIVFVYEQADKVIKEISKEELELTIQGGRIREEKRDEEWKSMSLQ